MKSRTLPVAMIILACAAATQSRLYAQTPVEYDCNGQVSVKEDNANILIHGHCSKIWIPGNGNTVTFDNTSDLKIAGDDNTVTQSGNNEGSAVKLWIAGEQNTLTVNRAREISLPGDNNRVTFGSTPDLKIAGDDNTVAQSGNIDGPATKIWIGGDQNALTANRASQISLAGDKNRVTHYSGNAIEPILLGDGNKVVAGKGPYPVKASSGTRNDKPAAVQASEQTSEAEREARNESGNASAKRQSSTSSSQAGQKSPDAKNVVDVLYLGDLNNYDVLVLYKDNTAVFNSAIPIDYLYTKEDKAKSSKRWRQWRREGGRIQVRGLSSSGKWFNLKDSSPTSLKPVQGNLRLSGKWSNYWTSADYTATGSSHYWFTKEGRFKTSSSSMMGASVPGISSSIAASTCDSSGSSTVANSSAAAGSTSISKSGKGCGAANVGEYKIDGYSITFNAENGKVYRRTFYRLDKETILIRGKWYEQFK